MFSTTAAERRRSLRRRFVACSVAATFVFAQLPLALASDESVAQELFDQGKRLMGEKKFAEACNAFQESYRLDAKTGALALVEAGRTALVSAGFAALSVVGGVAAVPVLDALAETAPLFCGSAAPAVAADLVGAGAAFA